MGTQLFFCPHPIGGRSLSKSSSRIPWEPSEVPPSMFSLPLLQAVGSQVFAVKLCSGAWGAGSEHFDAQHSCNCSVGLAPAFGSSLTVGHIISQHTCKRSVGVVARLQTQPQKAEAGSPAKAG